MNTLLAWFITFNFINLTWIFFRAKEWSDAKNVLSGMVGGNGMIPSNAIQDSKQFFLEHNRPNLDIFVPAFDGANTITVALLITFFIILKFKNSTENLPKFTTRRKEMLFFTILMVYTLLHLNNMTEFLYFNF